MYFEFRLGQNKNTMIKITSFNILMNKDFIWTSLSFNGVNHTLINEIYFEDIKEIYVCNKTKRKQITKSELISWFESQKIKRGF